MTDTYKLLLVEDEPDLCEALAEDLLPLNFEIVMAKNGVEAFKILK